MWKVLLPIGAMIVLLLLYYTPRSRTPPNVPRARGPVGGIETCRDMYRGKVWSRGGVEINAILDMLVKELLAVGENAPVDDRLSCFRRAETALNALYTDKIIGPEEAGELFYLGQGMAMAVRLDLAKVTKQKAPSLLVIGRAPAP